MNQPTTKLLSVDAPPKTSGGLWALGGYLYQFVGGIARAIRTFAEWEMDADRDGWKVVFSMEEFDQDAVEQFEGNVGKTGFSQVTKRRLIQFKFSHHPEKHPIDVAEMLEIVTALMQSQIAANRIAEVPTAFVVITNRPLRDNAIKATKAAKSWKMPQNGQKPIPVLDDFILVGKKKPTTKRKWSAAAIKVLAEIDWQQETMREQMAAIKCRAYSLGVLPDEIDDSIARLIGFYFSEVSRNSLQVTNEQINACLGGMSKGRPLISDEARWSMYDDYKNFLYQIGASNKTAPRHFELDLKEAMGRHALIFLYGEGGNGKTTLLCRLIESSLTYPRNSNCDAAFGGGFCAAYWTENVLSTRVGVWRGDSENMHTNENWGLAIRRLEMAATVDKNALPVILHLGLDAVDEMGGRLVNPHVDQLIAEFDAMDRSLKPGERPQMVLVVTCREDPERFISPENPFFRIRKDGSKQYFKVPKFTPQELADIASIHGNSQVQISLAARLRRQTSLGNLAPTHPVALPPSLTMTAREVFELDDNEIEGNSWDENFLESLLHPTLWQYFQELSPREQEAALLGDLGVRVNICSELVMWFVRKTSWRHRTHMDAVMKDGKKVLLYAARALDACGQVVGEERSHWMEPAIEVGINPELARLLYREADSSGLIVEDSPGRWRWRHAFIQDALLGGNQ